MQAYQDRKEAGQILSQHLQAFRDNRNTIILALPRGGVPVAYEIARALALPLSLFIVRKLGVPGHEELAMGAIASGDNCVFNTNLIQALGISKEALTRVIAKEKQELHRREKQYQAKTLPPLQDKTILLVDDGIATGFTMKAAVEALSKEGAQHIILAVPVAAKETIQDLTPLVDEIICPLQPVNLGAVGLWYANFTQVTDEEVLHFMQKTTDLKD